MLQYVQLLRKLKMHSKLRTARQSMQQLYPLTEELWLEWLNDETTCLEGIHQVGMTYRSAIIIQQAASHGINCCKPNTHC